MTSSGHRPGPAIEGLGLVGAVERTHVGYMGCHGALNGLRVARAFTGSERRARVLLVAVELSSLHYHYGWDPQRMVANALFAECAPTPPSSAAMPTAAASARRLAGGGQRLGVLLVPGSADAMTWTVGDHGFAMTLSKRGPALIAAHLRPWLRTWLAEQGLDLTDVASWVVHPGGPRILEAVDEALVLPREALAVSREVFAECGNMSSPTVLFILDRLRRAGRGPAVRVAGLRTGTDGRGRPGLR